LGYLYILESLKNGRFYIGSSADPDRRLEEKHNNGRVIATRYLRSWKLVFKQKYSSGVDARRVEYKLKSYKSRKVLKKIIKGDVCSVKI